MAEDKTPKSADKSADKSTDRPTAKSASSAGSNKPSAKKAAVKTAVVKKQVAKKSAAVNAQQKNTSKEEKKRKLEDIITKQTGSGADKKHAIEKLQKEFANNIIMSKKRPDSVDNSKATDEIKRKAAEAKKRAQDEILSQGYIGDQNAGLHRLADTFDKSARRWEMVVYPSLFAFILLAGYGFYLIYHLTHDISVLSRSVTHMATIVSDTMPRMSSDLRGMTGNIGTMTGSVNNMTGSVNSMTGDIKGMSTDLNQMSDQMTTLEPMSQNLANMTNTMGNMNRSVYGMQRDMSGMNRTISNGPFGFMQDMMPFSSNSYTRPPPPVIYPPARPKPLKRPALKPAPVKKRTSPTSGLQLKQKQALAQQQPRVR
jgi:methyl-accepting chemotaxis protein